MDMDTVRNMRGRGDGAQVGIHAACMMRMMRTLCLAGTAGTAGMANVESRSASPTIRSAPAPVNQLDPSLLAPCPLHKGIPNPRL
ncbi:hypothetical protein E4U42_006149 [Claviceps africana]|uniref:Uncharacterized protein n=1 Tax=Claviceps africana TaxID=83212 RepID=A0A8K0NF50_9HYPO|nr:hypothetical protein E4U42_006149 [Claviceps africana]